MNTIREIITHNPKCLSAYLGKLIPLLVEHSKNDDEQIRHIVAENIGKLFVYYSHDMLNTVENSFKSGNNFERATIVKSFKYAGSRETEAMPLEICVEHLVKLV